MTTHNHKSLKYTLKGFSGCRLEILQNGNTSFVRKTSGGDDQNGKIYDELEKLKVLTRLSRETGFFQIPDILDKGTDDQGLVYYDLEFIPSWELASRLDQMQPGEIQSLTARLFEIITAFSQTKATLPIHNIQELKMRDFLLNKLQETGLCLDQFLDKWPQVSNLAQVYSESLEQLKTLDLSLLDLESFCHGDLALDNILIGKDQCVYLIDPLVNALESYMWDISKVLQSSLVHWRQIKQGAFDIDIDRQRIWIKANERLQLFHSYFSDMILERYPPDVILLFLGVTIARVVKYAKTFNQLSALLILTNELLKRYIERRYDLDEPLNTLRW